MAQDLFEVYGVKAPEETTNDEQQPGAQAEETEEGVQDNAEQSGQSREENSKYASARRKAEAERDAAIKENNQKWEERIKRMGIKNPYTKSTIESWDDYEKYEAQKAEKKRERLISKLDMTEEQYQEMVDEMPEVEEAKAKSAEAEKILEQERQRQWREMVEGEIRKISSLNPKIKSAEDLAKLDRYDQILQLIDRGNEIYDAYRLAYFDELAMKAGNQKAINLAGKAHMGRTQERGTGALRVPENVMRNYRQLVPGATEEQIAAHYNRMMQSASED